MINMMYHFVGCDERLKSISLNEFRKQLDYLQENYKADEFVTTFDHGTIDHIEIVAPELEKRGIRGLFFILTMIPEEYRIPTIDKQRFIEKEHRHQLAKMICDELFIPYHPKDASNYLEEFPFYSLEERYLRYLRDHSIPTKVYDSLIGKLFHNIFSDEKEFALNEYLNWHHIYQLHKRGHIIGSHSHYHYGDGEDYTRSLRLIESVINEKPHYISYPNGNKRIDDKDLEKLDIKFAYLSRVEGTGPYRTGRTECKLLNI